MMSHHHRDTSALILIARFDHQEIHEIVRRGVRMSPRLDLSQVQTCYIVPKHYFCPRLY